jgi:hypothetical protein
MPTTVIPAQAGIQNPKAYAYLNSKREMRFRQRHQTIRPTQQHFPVAAHAR